MRHALVQGDGEWSMWCSGGRGREDNPHGNRMCSTCRGLIRAAVAAGDLDAKDAGRWM